MYISFLKALDFVFSKTNNECGDSKSQRNRVSYKIASLRNVRSYTYEVLPT